MADKFKEILWNLMPEQKAKCLEDLNRVLLKHGAKGTSTISGSVSHQLTPDDLKHARIGADVRRGGASAAEESWALATVRERNIKLARKYLKDRPGSDLSDSELKKQVSVNNGGPRSRSAAIEAVNDGLRRLKNK